MNRYDLVRKQLEERRGDWPRIAVRAEVGYQWLVKMMAGKFDDPGVRKIERLYAALGNHDGSGCQNGCGVASDSRDAA